MVERLFGEFFHNRVVRVISLLLILIISFSLYHRYIQQDEPWFGEQAYWLLKERYVKIKSMPGVFDWTNKMLIFHKLFVWVGAVIITIFGWSLYPMKLFILACFTLLACFLNKHASDLIDKKKWNWLTLLLLISIPELIHRSFMFRPEVMIMFLGFLSYYCLINFENKGRAYLAVLAGLFSGLAFLTHLNAVVFPVVGFIFLLWRKEWKGLLFYSLVCFGVCMIYTIGLWDANTFNQYMFEMKHWPTHQKTFGDKVNGGILDVVYNNVLRLLGEHKRYFWDQDVWGISGLFLVTIIAQFRYLWNNYRALTQYTLLSVLCLAVLSSSPGPRYLVYIMPYMILTTAVGISRLKDHADLVGLKAFYVLAVAAQLVFASLTLKSIFEKNYNHVALHDKYLSSIPEGDRVLAPWEFIYNHIDDHQIFSYKTYEYIEDQERIKLSQLDLLQLAAEKFEMDYIIVDHKRKDDEEFPWFNQWEIHPNNYYKEDYRTDKFLILKRIAATPGQ